MGSDELDQHARIAVGDMDDEPILFTSYVEDHAVVPDKIGGSEHGSDVSRSRPCRSISGRAFSFCYKKKRVLFCEKEPKTFIR